MAASHRATHSPDTRRQLGADPATLSSSARQEWAAYHGETALGYNATYELNLDVAAIEADIHEASPASIARLEAQAQRAERLAPGKDFDIERTARKNLSPRELERWEAAEGERARIAFGRLHVDKRGFLTGPARGAVPWLVWRARRRASLPVRSRREQPRRRPVRRRRLLRSRSSRGDPPRPEDDPDEDLSPAAGRIASRGPACSGNRQAAEARA